MRGKTAGLMLVVVGLLGLCSSQFLRAQESKDQNSSAKPASEEPKAKSGEQRSTSAYRLDFLLNELEDGKRVNARQYSLNLVPGFQGAQELKIGARVPVEMKQGEMQYIDVGTNLWARLIPVGDVVELEARADLSSFADPEQQTRTSMPLLRQLHISGSTIATSGKAIIVGIVDDPNSKRQFQLEVTVNKLR
jgi:hypothetical protein